jgi:hypothetical protein
VKTNGNTWLKTGHGWLVLAVAVLLAQAGCRTATPEPWSYQWQQGAEGNPDTLYAINQDTGNIAVWNSFMKEWDVLRTDIPPLDWEGALARRDAWIKKGEEERVRQETEREAVRAAFAQLTLTEQVAKALEIEIRTYREPTPQEIEKVNKIHKKVVLAYTGELFKRGRGGAWVTESRRRLDWTVQRPDVKEGDIVVVFKALAPPCPPVEDYRPGVVRRKILREPPMYPSAVDVYLSSVAVPDKKLIFPVSPTIVEDVKTEIERQKALSDAGND